MNDVIQTIYARHSTRKFASDPVPEDVILTLLECARWAPSGSNQQPWFFDVVKETDRITAIADIIDHGYDAFLNTILDNNARAHIAGYGKYLGFIRFAPLVIAVSAKPYESFLSKKLKKYGIDNPFSAIGVCPASLSIGAAVENMLLAAESLGFSSCWMTGPMIFQKELEKFFNMRSPWHLVSLLAIGRPCADEQANRVRFSLSEISSFAHEKQE